MAAINEERQQLSKEWVKTGVSISHMRKPTRSTYVGGPKLTRPYYLKSCPLCLWGLCSHPLSFLHFLYLPLHWLLLLKSLPFPNQQISILFPRMLLILLFLLAIMILESPKALLISSWFLLSTSPCNPASISKLQYFNS